MSAIPSRIYETRIGSYKHKKPRITFEKRRLVGTAFLPGTKFRIDFKGSSATITLDENGSRQVTSRNGDPVIDIKADEIAHAFNGLTLIKAIVGEREIELSPMKEAIEQSRAAKKAIPKRQYKVLDVFGSIGTLAKALSDTGGFKIRGVVDINEAALDTYRKNHPDAVIWAGDVANVEWERFKDADIVVMTPSCRPFTNARQSAKEYKEDAPEGDNTAHSLVGLYIIRPAAILLEEVIPYRDSYSYALLKSLLIKMGYHISEAILDAGDFGALSFRKRFCMVASMKEGFSFGTPEPRLPKQVSEILEIPIDQREWPTDLKRFETYGDVQVAKGNNFRMQRVTVDHDRVRHPTTRYYARQSEPFLVHPNDPSKLDRFTPRELARIASLPDDYILPESRTAAASGIGDGVVYEKFFHVGKQLYRHLSEKNL